MQTYDLDTERAARRQTDGPHCSFERSVDSAVPCDQRPIGNRHRAGVEFPACARHLRDGGRLTAAAVRVLGERLVANDNQRASLRNTQ